MWGKGLPANPDLGCNKRVQFLQYLIPLKHLNTNQTKRFHSVNDITLLWKEPNSSSINENNPALVILHPQDYNEFHVFQITSPCLP